MEALGINELHRESEGYTQKTNNKYASDIATHDGAGEMVFMSGAEAIARGAIEAGVAVAASFPGSPATWVHENLLMAGKKLDEFYVEWSVSETKSWDVCLGAALAGRRAFLPIKQVGVNWIVDVVSDWVHKRALRAGLVILSGDDPGADTTSREQDTRMLVPFLEVPLLQAASVQEQKDVILEAFALSEKICAPVMVSVTRQMMYGRGPVRLGEIDHERRRLKLGFQRRPELGYTWVGNMWSTTGIAEKHGKFHETSLALAQEHAETSPLNRLEMRGGERIGIIASEQAYSYARQSVHALGLDGQIAFLKIGTTWPMPRGLTTRLLESVETVVMIEELEPFIENQVRAMTSTLDKHARILGKSDGIGLPFHDAYNTDLVSGVLAKVTGIDYTSPMTQRKRSVAQQLRVTEVPDRPFTLCAGCPEMGALWIMKETMRRSERFKRRDVISVIDEGCYTASETEPFNMGDVMTCMGSSISLAHGLYTGVEQKLLVQIGDGSFLHNGLQGLINAVHNKAKMTIVIHDNRATAATGQQPVASGFGFNARGEPAPRVDIEGLCRAVGVEWVKKIDPFDVEGGITVFNEALEYDGISVMISDAPCSIIETRRVGSRGSWSGQLATYRIDADKCTSCELCSRVLGCLAIEDQGTGNAPTINDAECIGCDVCRQMCPDDAIFRITIKTNEPKEG